MVEKTIQIIGISNEELFYTISEAVRPVIRQEVQKILSKIESKGFKDALQGVYGILPEEQLSKENNLKTIMFWTKIVILSVCGFFFFLRNAYILYNLSACLLW